MTNEQMKTIEDFGDLLTKQIEKINKKGDIAPEELQRMDKAVDILKDISVICAMEEYGEDPEMKMYSSTGYYGASYGGNSRGYMPMDMGYGYSANGNGNGGYSSRRNSMGRYSRGRSMDDANHKMRMDLEDRLNHAEDQSERDAIMKCLRALDG